MYFDGSFAGAEFRRHLLVKHPRNNEAHHLALASAQGVVPLTQFRYLSLLFAGPAVSIERSPDGVKQVLLPEGLRKKLDSALLHGPYGHRNVCMRRNKDNGDTNCRFS